MARVGWRGGVFDERSRDMLEEVARLTPDLPTIVVTQGSYSGSSKSADTHLGGGAVDLDLGGWSPEQRDRLVRVMRQVGWAAWIRGPHQGFAWHIHGIAVNCMDLSGSALSQVRDYFDGHNGLAARGKDDGPRDWVGATWETYSEAKAKDQAKEVAAMAANVWFMQSDHETVYVVSEDLSGKWPLPDPTVAGDVAHVIRAGGGKVLQPPKDAPVGSVGGAPVWAGVRPKTLASIPTR